MRRYMPTFALLGPLGALCACNTPTLPLDDGDEPEATPSALTEVATPGERADAVEIWADQAAILAVLDIESAVVTPDGDGLVTTAGLHVAELLRTDAQITVQAGDRLWMEIPGGQLGERSQLTSAAPLLFEGDTVLARLVIDEAGELAFDGHSSVIPVEEGVARVCVNPEPGAVLRCIESGSAVIAVEELPLFAGADADLDLPLETLRAQLR